MKPQHSGSSDVLQPPIESTPECGQDATFAFEVGTDYTLRKRQLQAAVSISNSVSRGSSGNSRIAHQNFSKVARCTRNNHSVIYHFRAFNDGVMKTGQYPSMADISLGEISRYRKVLDKTDMKGLSMAIGLHAHGVGAGAFIYLRKIFEAQVECAHMAAQTDACWDEVAYVKLGRISDRIQALQLHLPEVLVRNSSLYSILSAHLHDGMSEEDCLINFDVVLQGIIVIADERLAQLERAQRLAQFDKSKTTFLQAHAEPPVTKDKTE